MLHPICGGKTCAEAWLTAAEYLVSESGEAYNLVVDIDDPTQHLPKDDQVILAVDAFLRNRRANPISTVSNTIFPVGLYRRYGERFRTEYLRGYDSLRKKGWGRYFERLVRWQTDDGRTINQLEGLIKALAGQLSKKSHRFKNIYEVSLLDPAHDKFRERNRQCLSFLSFKLHPCRGLMLTALYRNHHYIARALGNFIGLGHLMKYIANEVGTTVGSLTCVSTHAEIDVASRQPTGDDDDWACKGWTIKQARQLIEDLSAANRLSVAVR
jgi:hypothetical protein